MSDAATTPALALTAGNKKFKQGLLFGGGAFAALLTLLLVVPHFVDLGLFKATYLPLVEDALGRRIDVGEVHLRLVPTPSIQISKLRVSDSQSYADNTFFAAHQVQLKLKFLPLLRGRFEVTELVLDKPIFNLLKQADGSFNYADIAGKKTPAAPRREVRKKTDGGKKVEAIPLALPSRMSIREGQMNLVTKGQTPVNIKGIELTLQEMSGDSPFPFRASFQYPGLKAVVLEGQLNYQEEKALLELKNNRLKIYDLTLPVQGSVSNLGTTPKVNLTLNSDDVDAKPIFQILSVFGLAPSDTEISGPMALNMTIAGPSNALVTEIRGVFKDVYVKGKRALKGNLTGEVNLRLPTRRRPGESALARQRQTGRPRWRADQCQPDQESSARHRHDRLVAGPAARSDDVQNHGGGLHYRWRRRRFLAALSGQSANGGYRQRHHDFGPADARHPP